MESLMDWVQTRPMVLKAVSSVTNAVDPRNWALTILLYMLDLCINVSSIYYAWDTDAPAVGCMMGALLAMALQIPLIGFYFQYAVNQRKVLLKVFKDNDHDGDGLLTPEEAATMLEELPKGTFELEFSEKLSRYSMDHMLWCHHQPRIVLFRMLEFSTSWLMFFASLMLIVPGEKITSLVAIQGVVSVIGLMLVLNDFFDNYFRKYRSTKKCLKFSCAFWYAFTLLAIFGVLLAGYGFASLIYEGRYAWPVHVNTTVVPQDDLVGFVTGWLLTAFVLFMFLQMAFLYFALSRCGYVKFHVSHVGEDNPVKLLGSKISAFSSKSRKASKEGVILRKSEEIQRQAQTSGPSPSDYALPAPLPPPPELSETEPSAIVLV